MANEQFSIFDFVNEDNLYKIDKPIRLIEFFAGVGAQHKALTNLKCDFESYKICEWALPSIIGYNAIHLGNFNGIYDNASKDELAQFLFDKGVSLNYDEPATLDQLKRVDIKKLKQCANSIVNLNNLVDISRVTGKSLNIVDKHIYIYILTYSYPCQDLSLAGSLKGQQEGSGTRSSLLWEVGRILKELKDTNSLPQILLMENVPNCHGTNNLKEWHKWLRTLESLGYTNFWKDLIATDYEIPQTRNRCYMVSLLNKDKIYNFPKKKKLKLKLKDLLEDNVDEKYYISQKMLEGMSKTNYESYSLEHSLQDTNKNCRTLLAGYNRAPLTIIDGVAIPSATKKGYEIAHEGDGVYTNRPQQKRGTVQRNKIQTLKTSIDDIGVVVKPNLLGGVGNKCNNNTQYHTQNRIYDDNIGVSVNTAFNPYYYSKLRIRKLTPLECFRLMGFDDEDYYKMKDYLSDSQLYHCMGDSIVVKVLYYIFKQLLTPTTF